MNWPSRLLDWLCRFGGGATMDADDLRLREQIAADLGDSPYLRSNAWGHLVAGVGRTMQSQLRNHESGQGIDPDLVQVMFERDVESRRDEILTDFPWTRHLSAPRMAVLIGLAMEPGPGWYGMAAPVLNALARAVYAREEEQRLAAYGEAGRQLLVAIPWPRRDEAQQRSARLALQLTSGEWQWNSPTSSPAE